MAQAHLLVGSSARGADPAIRRIGPADLKDALAKGWADFAAMPSHALFLCIIYPVIGMVLAGLTLGFSVLPLLYPLAAGFTLIGPFAAIGLYELSRRREMGREVSVTDAGEVMNSRSIDAIIALGALLLVIFLIWIAAAIDRAVRERGAVHADRLEPDPHRQCRWVPVRGAGVDDQRGVVPAVARS
jgi:uncharacterized membrane protein